ncbi:uncharacterized protein RJT21DRAFT_111024 [Scheffersomyces amazonensis]|uniref:uncharacterized protein n=1 Tax=Scheffersomyces amazonensis TaxID=1078765 RepID=UPI00315D8630
MSFQINTFRAGKPSNTHSFNTKHSGNSTSNNNNDPLSDEKVTKKRRRLTLVCDNCKKRKIKCNKQLPCDSCIKSSMSHLCAYHDSWEKNGVVTTAISGKSDTSKSSSEISTSLPYISSARRPIILDETNQYNAKHLHNNHNHNHHHNNHDHKPKQEVKLDIYKQELLRLKARIKHLESINNVEGTFIHENPSTAKSPSEVILISSHPVSVSTSRSSGSSITVPDTPPTLPLPLSYNTASLGTPSVSSPYPSAYSTSIKLPPIQWKPPHDNKSIISSSSSLRSESTNSTTSTSESEVSPNTNCKTNGTSSTGTCLASVVPISNSSSMLLSFIGINPVFHHEEAITFYKYSQSSPFSWSTLMKSDPRLRVLLQHVKLRNCKLDDDVSCPSEKLVEGTKFDANYTALLKNSIKVSQPQNATEGNLIARIVAVLPSHKNLMGLIEQYFEYVYPILAFVDEREFRSEIKRLLKVDPDNDKIIDINIKDYCHDLSVVGILLVVLRLSFISLLRNSHEYNTQALKQNELFETPINFEHVALAQETLLILMFDHKYEEFIFLQFLLFFRFYVRIAPEDGFRKDPINYNKALLDMAVRLQLNFDPDVVNFSTLTKREKTLRRKVWQSILLADIHNSLVFGNEPATKNVFYNTKSPTINSEEESNLINYSLEGVIFNDIVSRMIQFNEAMKQISNFITNSHSNKCQLIQLIERLNQFEINVSDYFNDLFSYLVSGYKAESNGVYNFRRVHQIKIYLSVINFIITVYYYIYLYYEELNVNISFFYLKKTIIYLNELIPYYKKLAFNSTLQCDFLYNATLQAVIHKSSQILLSLVIKFYEQDELKTKLLKNYHILIEILDNLSTRYFYSWKITKSHRYFFTIFRGENFVDFYNEKAAEYDNIRHNYNDYQIQELMGIIDYSLKRLENQAAKDEHQIQLPISGSENGDVAATAGAAELEDLTEPDFGFDSGFDDQWLNLMFKTSSIGHGTSVQNPLKDVSLLDIYQEFGL